MTKEQQYAAALEALGVYDRAFDGEIHQLCILERELSRTMKQWKATAPEGAAPDPTDPLYAVITQQRRDILAHRDALGLTPKALRRLKAASIVPEASAAVDAQGGSPVVSALLDTLRAQANVNAGVSESDTDHG